MNLDITEVRRLADNRANLQLLMDATALTEGFQTLNRTASENSPPHDALKINARELSFFSLRLGFETWIVFGAVVIASRMKRLSPEPLSSAYGRERGGCAACFFLCSIWLRNDHQGKCFRLQRKAGFNSGYKVYLRMWDCRIWWRSEWGCCRKVLSRWVATLELCPSL